MVSAIALQGEANIVVAPGASVIRLNMNGAEDNSFATALISGETVSAITVASDGSILIGGEIDGRVNGEPRNGIARLHPDGTLASNFGLTGPNSRVLTLALQPDGKIVIGGQFTAIRNETRNRIARLNPDGSLDSAFGEDLAGASDAVEAAVLQPDGRILIGGAFSAVNGEPRNGLARLNPDGTLDRTFVSNGVGGELTWLRTIALQADGRILIGGRFEDVDGVPRRGIARLNSDGTVDEMFGNKFTGVGGPHWARVSSIAPQPDGKILIGGEFTTVNGVARNRIARLNSDGSLDAGFGDGLAGVEGGTAPEIFTIAVQNDEKIVIGGAFEFVNGVARKNLARLNSDGSLDRTFSGEAAGSGWRPVFSTAIQSDGKTLIGGMFQAVNGELRGGIARLHEDGSLDSTFGEGLPGAWRPDVSAIAIDCEDMLLIGGDFTQVNWARRDRVARLYADTPSAEDGYQAWAQSLPPCLRGEQDDPGGFGIPNLLRYAFGMDPLKPERQNLPQLGQRTDEGEMASHLTLTYTRRTDDPQIHYVVEASEDLSSWIPLSGAEEVDCHGELELVTFIDSEATGPKEKRFLRVRVEPASQD